MSPSRLSSARLYLVTPSIGPVPAALDGGVDMVQLRDKDISDADLLARARALSRLCRERGVPFLLNDRLHLVRAAGADGVHLGEDDAGPEQARRLLGRDAIVGLSAHDRAEVAAAEDRGADYIGLGPMFATETKALERAPRGAALLRAIRGASALPVFPIGGIDATNLPDLIAAGATRAAVSGAICNATDPRAAAATLSALL